MKKVDVPDDTVEKETVKKGIHPESDGAKQVGKCWRQDIGGRAKLGRDICEVCLL